MKLERKIEKVEVGGKEMKYYDWDEIRRVIEDE